MKEQCAGVQRHDIEKLLEQGKTVQFGPIGYSMYPLFVPGRDEAVVAPANPAVLKRGDVALYRRDESILVLHRIWKRKSDGFYMVDRRAASAGSDQGRSGADHQKRTAVFRKKHTVPRSGCRLACHASPAASRFPCCGGGKTFSDREKKLAFYIRGVLYYTYTGLTIEPPQSGKRRK